jgi:hypothetical protein
VADDQGTKVSPQDQASASGPKNPAPQDNGSDTSAASSTPTKKKKDDDTPSDDGRGAGLHR